VSETGKPPADNNLMGQTMKVALYGMGATGCVTIGIIGAFVTLGLWLDSIFNSSSHLFMIGSIVLSVPVVILALIWTVRKITARLQSPAQTEEKQQVENLQEDA
jgi:uncharacterized membrane protein YeaQ/YmgE (transglycosylase-associated protein family)